MRTDARAGILFRYRVDHLITLSQGEVACKSRLIFRITPWLLVLAVVSAVPSTPTARAQTSAEREDEQTLLTAGLAVDGPALLAFFQARARTEIDGQRLDVLVRQLASSNRERSLATAELLGMGPLAVPILRRVASDPETPNLADRARHCLQWLEGPSSAALPPAAARVLVRHKPEGAAAALLAYLPYADNSEVLQAITSALTLVAAPGGKADPALLRGLTDPLAVRRAVAAVALCRARGANATPLAVRKLLHDPARGVRLRAGLALAEAHDAEAIPVLIDLLADLPVESRHRVEEFLRQLAGEWAPVVDFKGEDEIAGKIRRDVWAAWWKNVEGEALLAALRKRTLTAKDRDTIRGLLGNLGSEDFASRETASRELFALGRRSLPQLREAVKEKDAEVARRSKLLMERIEQEPSHHLPSAAVRLLALRKPAGSAAALLDYLPFAEDENLTAEVQKSLNALALRDGKLDPALLRALADNRPQLRAAAAEALVQGGETEGRAAARALLKDAAPVVRLRTALALAMARERDGVPVLIDLLTVLSGEHVGQVEDALYQLAGDTAPKESLGAEPAEKKKYRDAWAAWWKVNAGRVDLGRLTNRVWYGYTLVCDCSNNRVFELDREGKERWGIDNVPFPVDAWVLPGNRVLIAEYNGRSVTERDFKGQILWSKAGLPGNPVNVQRLGNGNTFIATDSQIFEVDRTGKEVYTINNVPGGVTAAYRARNGHIIALAQAGQCVILDTTGKQLKSFASHRNAGWTSGIDLLSSGRVLITQPDRNKVAEYDTEGKMVLEVDAPLGTTATGLPNGHILVASHQGQRVFEVDRAGKTVWEFKAAGNIFRARRR
jgi:HEAT repeat protein